jgi:transcriptional regulator with XRE-family HTH domain
MVTNMKQPDPIDVDVGRRIRVQRLARGMTQTQLATMIGVTFQQVQKYERGTNRVGASRLQSIAHVLGVSVSFFFEGPSSDEATAGGLSANEDVMRFVGTVEGLALNAAFARVTKPDVRRRIAALVTAIAKATTVMPVE